MTISKLPEGRVLEQYLRVTLVLNVAQYFEDIVGDVGVWASFTVKHKGLYGKPLPFYDVYVEDYYPDEFHLDDIRYIIWDILAAFNYETIYNPETPVIMMLAMAIETLLEKEWDRTPINEGFKEYLTKALFQHNLFEMRNMLQYFFTIAISLQEDAMTNILKSKWILSMTSSKK